MSLWLIWIGALIVLTTVALQLRQSLRAAERKRRRASRRRKNVAHRKAWDWVMGRTRMRRLSDQRGDRK
jgi:hypothetical protein